MPHNWTRARLKIRLALFLSDRVLPEQAGGDADVAAEAVDEVFLAVVAGGIGDLLDRELG